VEDPVEVVEEIMARCSKVICTDQYLGAGYTLPMKRLDAVLRLEAVGNSMA
jgi:hypothetical protein